MTRLSYLLLALILLLLPSPIQAQRKKVSAKKTATKKVADKPAENPRFLEMLESAQQVVFIDSAVVDSADFLKAIIVNPEEGRVCAYNKFFRNQQHGRFVYVNELGNKAVFSMNNGTGHTRLYTSDLLGNEWSSPELLKGLDDSGLSDLDYPFLMPDGLTLYFAAKGGEGLGGYDIYRTRFDAESGNYLKPENLGLPFNSDAHDYMYVVSEQDSIGFFVTNRRQPAGHVCIYTFIPTESRVVYDADAIGEAQLLSLARIERIADTWGTDNKRKTALARLAQLRSRQDCFNTTQQASDSEEFTIVIDDKRTYTRLSDFNNADNKDRMRELLNLQQQTELLQTALKKARDYYASASTVERSQLRSEILQSEQQLETLQMQMQQIEKEIRNNEINN